MRRQVYGKDVPIAKTFEDDYNEVICYGISFYKKRQIQQMKPCSGVSLQIYPYMPYQHSEFL